MTPKTPRELALDALNKYEATGDFIPTMERLTIRALLSTDDGLVRALERIANLSLQNGVEGATYGDTEYRSVDVAYGYNAGVCLAQLTALKALEAHRKAGK